jgi:hypothetical protein
VNHISTAKGIPSESVRVETALAHACTLVAAAIGDDENVVRFQLRLGGVLVEEDYFAPNPESTMPIVRQAISKSSQAEKFLM